MLTLGSYAQSYNDKFGLFADFGYEFDIYNIANTNNKNNKQQAKINTFYNHALYGELGFLTVIDNGYFKLGINYSHSIINNASNKGLMLTGGYRF